MKYVSLILVLAACSQPVEKPLPCVKYETRQVTEMVLVMTYGMTPSGEYGPVWVNQPQTVNRPVCIWRGTKR